jgi:predicted esterase
MTAAIAATALAVLAIALLGAQGADAKAKHKHKAKAKVEKGPAGLKFYKPPKGGWPVISFAHGTTGSADACAPSRAASGNPASLATTYIYPQQNEWLRNGYAVVRTDYQGLGTPGPHPYLIGRAEGRSVLDIVTAARELDKRISKRFLIAGHSQGGQSALFAAGDAASWTPKLKLRGTVAFAPASHIYEQKSLLPALTTPSGLTALAFMIIHGAATQSSAINVNAILSDEVLPYNPRLETECLTQLASSSELGGIPPSHLVRSGADTSTIDPVLKAMNPAVKTAAPILLSQGEADTTVFKPFTDTLNTELNGLGGTVIYKTYPGADHVGVTSAGEADALAFFRAQLPPR